MKIGKMSVLRNLVFNDRLRDYKWYLSYAKRKGYEIISLEKFYFLKDRNKGKHFVLRHDVDSLELSTRKMFETEMDIGVRSTYYFRKSTIDRRLIKDMLSAGFDVGFHFETIANYIRENDISDKDDIDWSILPDLLKAEIQDFNNEIGYKVKSICSHGAEENIKFNISNNVITENIDTIILGVNFEAYSELLYKDINCHIMDGTITNCFGFSYYENPISAADAGYNNILFLSHPEHWFDTKKRKRAKLRDICRGKAVFRRSNRKFIRVRK